MQENLQTEIATDAKGQRRRFLCPICKKHTLLWLLPTTEIKNLPIKCKRCGKEIIVDVKADEQQI